MAPEQTALWAVLGVALFISVLTDVVHRRIPDVVTYPALLAGLGVRFGWGGLGNLEEGLASGMTAAIGAAAVLAPWAASGRMGWGDVKLVAVVGACLGYPTIVAALICVALVGALQALVALLWKGAGQRIPYAVAIALGSGWALWWEHSSA